MHPRPVGSVRLWTYGQKAGELFGDALLELEGVPLPAADVLVRGAEGCDVQGVRAALVDLDTPGPEPLERLRLLRSHFPWVWRLGLVQTASLECVAAALNEGGLHRLLMKGSSNNLRQELSALLKSGGLLAGDVVGQLKSRTQELEAEVASLRQEQRQREQELEGEVSGYTRELFETMARMEQHVLRDPLTRLYNVKYFRSRVDSEVSRAERYHRPLALLFLDIDHFKQVNDRCGHPVGNQVIQEVARILAPTEQGSVGQLRRSDVACRYGGEEFVVILPETHARGAEIQAERIRQTAAGLRIPELARGGLEGITLSIGVAAYPESASSAERLVLAADQALLVAKAQGRNRVVTAPLLTRPSVRSDP